MVATSNSVSDDEFESLPERIHSHFNRVREPLAEENSDPDD